MSNPFRIRDHPNRTLVTLFFVTVYCLYRCNGSARLLVSLSLLCSQLVRNFDEINQVNIFLDLSDDVASGPTRFLSIPEKSLYVLLGNSISKQDIKRPHTNG